MDNESNSVTPDQSIPPFSQELFRKTVEHGINLGGSNKDLRDELSSWVPTSNRELLLSDDHLNAIRPIVARGGSGPAVGSVDYMSGDRSGALSHFGEMVMNAPGSALKVMRGLTDQFSANIPSAGKIHDVLSGSNNKDAGTQQVNGRDTIKGTYDELAGMLHGMGETFGVEVRPFTEQEKENMLDRGGIDAFRANNGMVVRLNKSLAEHKWIHDPASALLDAVTIAPLIPKGIKASVGESLLNSIKKAGPAMDASVVDRIKSTKVNTAAETLAEDPEALRGFSYGQIINPAQGQFLGSQAAKANKNLLSVTQKAVEEQILPKEGYKPLQLNNTFNPDGSISKLGINEQIALLFDTKGGFGEFAEYDKTTGKINWKDTSQTIPVFVKDALNDMASGKPKTFRDAFELQRQLDNRIDYNAPKPHQDIIRGLRGIIHNALTDASEQYGVLAGMTHKTLDLFEANGIKPVVSNTKNPIIGARHGVYDTKIGQDSVIDHLTAIKNGDMFKLSDEPQPQGPPKKSTTEVMSLSDAKRDQGLLEKSPAEGMSLSDAKRDRGLLEKSPAEGMSPRDAKRYRGMQNMQDNANFEQRIAQDATPESNPQAPIEGKKSVLDTSEIQKAASVEVMSPRDAKRSRGMHNVQDNAQDVTPESNPKATTEGNKFRLDTSEIQKAASVAEGFARSQRAWQAMNAVLGTNHMYVSPHFLMTSPGLATLTTLARPIIGRLQLAMSKTGYGALKPHGYPVNAVNAFNAMQIGKLQSYATGGGDSNQ